MFKGNTPMWKSAKSEILNQKTALLLKKILELLGKFLKDAYETNLS